MHDWSFPLIVATAAFFFVLVWRVRPEIGWGRQVGASRKHVRDARAKIEAATTETDRARALCEAAELLGPVSATGMYLRAVRTDPASSEIVERAILGLARRPRLLESVLWRHLAAAPWTGSPAATRASLEALVALYDGRLRDPTLAKALANALGVLAVLDQ